MSIDFHCHLDLYSKPISVVQECNRRGTYVLSVTTTPKAWNGTCSLSEGFPRIRTALGLHPQIAHERENELELFDALLCETKYVGEIGLDGGDGFKDHWQVQLNVFRHILEKVNSAGGRIMTIHSRASAAAVLELLPGVEGIPILHWFTGTERQLKRAIDMGCWFSVGPAMLRSKRGYGLFSKMPRERVLTETDGPFARHSGRSLFPWDVSLMIPKMAFTWKCDEGEAEQIVHNNFRNLLRDGP